MRKLVLTRKIESPQGTFGSLSGPGLFLYSAELPWRANRPGLSRIPAGSYQGRPYSSARFPNCYEIMGVPGREKILIHAGNWAGDIKAGLRSDVSGCILVGLETGWLRGQQALLSSGAALQKLRAWLKDEPFQLELQEAFPAIPARPAHSGNSSSPAGPDCAGSTNSANITSGAPCINGVNVTSGAPCAGSANTTSGTPCAGSANGTNSTNGTRGAIGARGAAWANATNGAGNTDSAVRVFRSPGKSELAGFMDFDAETGQGGTSEPDSVRVNSAALEYEEYLRPASLSDLAWLPDYGGTPENLSCLVGMAGIANMGRSAGLSCLADMAGLQNSHRPDRAWGGEGWFF